MRLPMKPSTTVLKEVLNPQLVFRNDNFAVTTVSYVIDPNKDYVVHGYCWSSNSPYGTADFYIHKGELIELYNGTSSGRAYYTLNGTTFSMQVTNNMHGMCHIVQLN